MQYAVYKMYQENNTIIIHRVAKHEHANGGIVQLRELIYWVREAVNSWWIRTVDELGWTNNMQ